jgi:hypothetical protein
VAPLAWLSLPLAGGIFAGVGTACLAWALMEFGFASLSAFASVCIWSAVWTTQWSPLLSASIVLSPLAFFLVAKPTVGLAYWIARPSWWGVAGAVALTALAFALDPQWITQWRNAVDRALAIAQHGFPYRAPVLMPGGVVILAVLTRWRRTEARLLAALACIPHTTLPYELVPLFLIPRGWRQCGVLVLLSHGMWWLVTYDPLPRDFYRTVIEYTRTAVPMMYLPCTLMILRRKNEGRIPAWLERRVRTWPNWLRGESRLADA